MMKCFFGRISASNKSFLGLRFFFNESMPTWSVLGEVPGFHVLHPFSSSLVALAGSATIQAGCSCQAGRQTLSPLPAAWNLESDSLNVFELFRPYFVLQANATHSHQFLCRLPQLQAICSSCVAPECKRHRPGAMPPNRNAQQDVRGQGHDVDLDEATFRVEIV